NRRKQLIKSGEINSFSKKIVDKIINSKEFDSAKNVALYYPLDGEINLLDLLKIKNKSYFFPRCKGDNLEFVKFVSQDAMYVDKYSIKVPKGESVIPEIFDVIYVPCLLANKDCYRLGWGKGYYDRFFSSNTLKCKKCIVVLSEFISDEFEIQEYDFQLDMLISED
ncbi:5-formyltetrahydrofolate cyclo-ligase, partial [bacterium]|nr:5-formyltetrahydrofolate cyclo-ligase [bacterium]